MTEEQKNKIDAMSHIEICRFWRFAPSDGSEKLVQGEAGQYLKKRLFEHFGGFTPEISKLIGW